MGGETWIGLIILIIISVKILKFIELFRDKTPKVITYIQQPPPQPQPQPQIPQEKNDLNDKMREEIRRQVELEVHQQLKNIRQRLEKDIEIGIIAHIHKQRARQARAQELKEKANK